MSNPWLKFYPQDWRADEKLRNCSLAARGLWLEMLAIMHRSDVYGYLLVNGKPATDAQLAVQVGALPDEVSLLVEQLETEGVFSRDRRGWIYSRRMMRDAKKARDCRENGSKGGNPSLRKQKENPEWDNPEDKAQKPEARSQKEREDKPLSGRGIPEWLPATEWRGFQAMRRKIKKPLTDRAAGMALRKLSELRDQGEDPAAVLDQSTLHCWQDLYPIREMAKPYDRDRITV